MKKSITILISIMFLSVSLSACSMQKRVDTYEFCDRFNSFYDQEILCPSDYYKSSSLNEYNYFIKINEIRTAIVTIQTDENNSVSSIQITITKDETEFSEEEKQQTINYFIHLSSVLTSQGQDNVLNQLTQAGFAQDQIGFNSYNFSFSAPQCKYTVLCSTYIISFYAELNI